MSSLQVASQLSPFCSFGATCAERSEEVDLPWRISLALRTVEDAGPYKDTLNFLMKTCLCGTLSVLRGSFRYGVPVVSGNPIVLREPLNILRAVSGEKIFRQSKQKFARRVYPLRRIFVTNDGKDSVDSPCGEFLEAPLIFAVSYTGWVVDIRPFSRPNFAKALDFT